MKTDDAGKGDVMEKQQPFPFALSTHLEIMWAVLMSMTLLCSKRGHLQAAGTLFRVIFENFWRARWIAHPSDAGKRADRARASFEYRRKMVRVLQGQDVDVRDEMIKQFGKDDAYGVIGFSPMLESMGEKDMYKVFQYASAIAHGTGQIRPEEISFLLCEAAWHYAEFATCVWKACKAENILDEEFPASFAEAALDVYHERKNNAKKVMANRQGRSD